MRGADKIALKAILKDIALTGDAVKGVGKRIGKASALPPTDVLDVTHADKNGDLFAKPVNWTSDEAPPKIVVINPKKGGPRRGRERPLVIGVGDRIFARISAGCSPGNGL